MILAALGDWFPFLVYVLLALAIPLSLLAMSFLFATRPKRRPRALTMPFESGVSEGPPPQQRFTVSFYLTALLFIVFDIEVVFLFPIAVVLQEVGWFALGAFLFYLGVLVVAFVYEWKKGASLGGEPPQQPFSFRLSYAGSVTIQPRCRLRLPRELFDYAFSPPVSRGA